MPNSIQCIMIQRVASSEQHVQPQCTSWRSRCRRKERRPEESMHQCSVGCTFSCSSSRRPIAFTCTVIYISCESPRMSPDPAAMSRRNSSASVRSCACIGGNRVRPLTQSKASQRASVVGGTCRFRFTQRWKLDQSWS